MFKEQKGITLVALVITIIVLLILAGVSISLVMGDNGVLGQAANAVDATELGSVRDELNNALASIQTVYYANMATGDATPLRSYITGSYIKNECPNAESVTINPDPVTDDGEVTVTYKHTKGKSYTCKLKVTARTITMSEDLKLVTE